MKTTTASLMTNIDRVKAAAANPEPDRDLAGLQLLCPVTHDRQLIAQGLNYASHLREVGIAAGAHVEDADAVPISISSQKRN